MRNQLYTHEEGSGRRGRISIYPHGPMMNANTRQNRKWELRGCEEKYIADRVESCVRAGGCFADRARGNFPLEAIVNLFCAGKFFCAVCISWLGGCVFAGESQVGLLESQTGRDSVGGR